MLQDIKKIKKLIKSEGNYAKGEYRDYIFFLKRVNVHWCGYVVVEPNSLTKYEIESLNVHGGITFDGRMSYSNTIYNVIGFDAAHAQDIWDVSGLVPFNEYQSYFTKEDAIAECLRLIDQIKDIRYTNTNQ